MNDAIKTDLGEAINKVEEQTICLGESAVAQTKQHILDLAGREFWGRSLVEIVWKAGQIVEIRPLVEAKRI